MVSPIRKMGKLKDGTSDSGITPNIRKVGITADRRVWIVTVFVRVTRPFDSATRPTDLLTHRIQTYEHEPNRPCLIPMISNCVRLASPVVVYCSDHVQDRNAV